MLWWYGDIGGGYYALLGHAGQMAVYRFYFVPQIHAESLESSSLAAGMHKSALPSLFPRQRGRFILSLIGRFQDERRSGVGDAESSQGCKLYLISCMSFAGCATQNYMALPFLHSPVCFFLLAFYILWFSPSILSSLQPSKTFPFCVISLVPLLSPPSHSFISIVFSSLVAMFSSVMGGWTL